MEHEAAGALSLNHRADQREEERQQGCLPMNQLADETHQISLIRLPLPSHLPSVDYKSGGHL